MRGLLVAAILLLTACSRPPMHLWDTFPDPAPMPALTTQGHVEREGARIWYGVAGRGPPVVMLHGGLGASDHWGAEARALIDDHHQVILIDSRGHGRSTRDPHPLTYVKMAADVLAVMDAVGVKRADIVGWSDGAIIGLVLAMQHPERLDAVYAFGANMDLKGFNPAAALSPALPQADKALRKLYARTSPTPGEYDNFFRWVLTMQATQPTYSAADLAAIHGQRIAIADAEHEEFILRAHTDYLARTIPGAKLVILPGVSHFAALQAPEVFSRSVIGFLDAKP